MLSATGGGDSVTRTGRPTNESTYRRGKSRVFSLFDPLRSTLLASVALTLY